MVLEEVRWRAGMQRAEAKGYLYVKPHVGDTYLLLPCILPFTHPPAGKKLREYFDLLAGHEKGAVDVADLLEPFIGRKVKITVEVLE